MLVDRDGLTQSKQACWENQDSRGQSKKQSDCGQQLLPSPLEIVVVGHDSGISLPITTS
jgi:hypothetical protein